MYQWALITLIIDYKKADRQIVQEGMRLFDYICDSSNIPCTACAGRRDTVTLADNSKQRLFSCHQSVTLSWGLAILNPRNEKEYY